MGEAHEVVEHGALALGVVASQVRVEARAQQELAQAHVLRGVVRDTLHLMAGRGEGRERGTSMLLKVLAHIKGGWTSN